jgi:hypothetical protein
MAILVETTVAGKMTHGSSIPRQRATIINVIYNVIARSIIAEAADQTAFVRSGGVY